MRNIGVGLGTLFLVGVAAHSLAACGGDDEPSNNPSSGGSGGSAGSGGSGATGATAGTGGSGGSTGGSGGSAGGTGGSSSGSGQLSINANADPSRVLPSWGALKDSAGWRQITVDSSGSWTEAVAGGDYDLVLACPDGDAPYMFYFAGTLGEGSEVDVACRDQSDPGLEFVQGTVENLAGAGFAVFLGGGEFSGPSVPSTFAVQSARGKHDAVVGDVAMGAMVPSTILVHRGVEVSATTAALTLDMSGVDAVTARTASGTGATEMAAIYWTENGSTVELGRNAATVSYSEPGANQQSTGDRFAIRASNDTGGVQVVHVAPLGDGPTLTLPSAATGAVAEVATSAATGVSMSWPADSDATLFVARVQDSTMAVGARRWYLGVTPGRATATPMFSSDDITGVAGFEAAFDLATADAEPSAVIVRTSAVGGGTAPSAAEAFKLHFSGLTEDAYAFTQMPPFADGVYEYLLAN